MPTEEFLTEITVTIAWNPEDLSIEFPIEGSVSIVSGKLLHCSTHSENGQVENGHFSILSPDQASLVITMIEARITPGAHPTLVTVENNFRSFSFFLRDVCQTHLIYIPDCAVAISSGNEPKPFKHITNGW